MVDRLVEEEEVDRLVEAEDTEVDPLVEEVEAEDTEVGPLVEEVAEVTAVPQEAGVEAAVMVAPLEVAASMAGGYPSYREAAVAGPPACMAGRNPVQILRGLENLSWTAWETSDGQVSYVTQPDPSVVGPVPA